MNRRARRAAATRGSVAQSKLSAVFGSERPFAVSMDDGRKIAVARPAKPEVALEMAKKALALGEKNPRVLDEEFSETGLPEVAGPYTFAGWLAAGDEGLVLDGQGKVVGKCEPGDSFLTIDEARLAEIVSKEN